MHCMNTKDGALWVPQKRGQLCEGSKENLKRRNGRQAISDTNGSERKLGPTNVQCTQIMLYSEELERNVCYKVSRQNEKYFIE